MEMLKVFTQGIFGYINIFASMLAAIVSVFQYKYLISFSRYSFKINLPFIIKSNNNCMLLLSTNPTNLF